MGDSREELEAAFEEHENEVDENTEEANTEPAVDSVITDIEPDVSVANDDESGASEPITTEKEAKAPQSWTPADREAWSGLPPNVQQAVLKREREIGESLQTTAESRHFSENFANMVKPYEGMFQAQGVDSLTGINNVLQTAATLQSGNVQQKAQAAAQLIRDFGVDIGALDDLIVGNMPTNAPTSEMQSLQDQINQQQQYINRQQQNEQYAQQQAQQGIQTEVNTFMADPANEFAQDLRPVMQQFMQIAAQNNQSLSLKDAYSRAMSTRPDLQQILANRGQGQTAQTALEAAKSASVSIAQNGKTVPTPPGDLSSRDAMVAAWDNLS